MGSLFFGGGKIRNLTPTLSQGDGERKVQIFENIFNFYLEIRNFIYIGIVQTYNKDN